MTENAIIITSTTDSKKEAEKIISLLLKKRLIACGNIIGPMSSVYWWKGSIEHSEEFLILMKSKRDLYKKIENEVLKLHSYETPEILVFSISEGSKSYLDWISNCIISS